MDNICIYIYILGSNLVIAVSADALAPNSTRTSAGTVLNEELDMFTSRSLLFSMTPYHLNGLDDVIKNDRRERDISRGTQVLTYRDMSREFHVNLWDANDVILYALHANLAWWRHQMETFPRYWPFVCGIHRSPLNSPHKGQWQGALIFSLICTLNKRLIKQSWGWWPETPSHSL